MENIKERIKKLLSLAENAGATEHEAERAMEMASALMLKYNIQLDPETDELRPIKGAYVGEGMDLPHHRVLVSASAYLFMCKSLINGPFGASCFIGRPENVSAAEATYLYLAEQVERFYKINLPSGLSKSDRAEYRRTFKYACACRVYHRAEQLMQQFRNDDAKAIEYTGSRALVLVASIDAQLADAEAFMKETMPNIKNAVVRAKRAGSGTRDGRAAGDKVELNRKIAG